MSAPTSSRNAARGAATVSAAAIVSASASVSAGASATVSSSSASVLSVRGLRKAFGGNLAVAGVDFDVDAGEMLALIGPNGAGKSTTFNMVGGQLPASGGSVRFRGSELLGLSARRIARLGIGRTFQIAAVFGSMTVCQNVQMALLAARRRVYGFWRPARMQQRAQALDLLEQVGMREQAQRPCSELAYGDVKRVELAMALAGDPALLLMDEPAAGMAPQERKALFELIRGLARARGMAVLFTEHSMDVVFDYADRVIVLARGRLIAQGGVSEIRAHPEVRRVYFGSGASFEAADTPAPGYDRHVPRTGAAGDGQLAEKEVGS